MKRSYRRKAGSLFENSLQRLILSEKESDIEIHYSHHVSGIRRLLLQCRRQLTEHIKKEPAFATSYTPLSPGPEDSPIIQRMKKAAAAASVGPMAAVAGAVAEELGSHYRGMNDDLIIENGGDLYLSLATDRKVLIYAGNSPLSNQLTLSVTALSTPLGICTSSGTVGHSHSQGNADAVVAVSPSTSLADAAATAVGNRVGSHVDIEKAIGYSQTIPGLSGVIIIAGSHVGFWGDVQLSPAKMSRPALE